MKQAKIDMRLYIAAIILTRRFLFCAFFHNLFLKIPGSKWHKAKAGANLPAIWYQGSITQDNRADQPALHFFAVQNINSVLL